MNQMHGAYDISNDDMRYVLSTFVVTPVRWLAEFGWRPFTPHEVEAWTHYYRAVGRHMGIQERSRAFDARFAALMGWLQKARHFAFDARSRGRRRRHPRAARDVPPEQPAPRRARATHLLRASWTTRCSTRSDSHAPTPFSVRWCGPGSPRAGEYVRFLPPRKQPRYARQLPNVRSYPNGYQIGRLGTFPTGPDSPDQGPQRATQPTTPPVVPDKH